ncbi:unnamed protein product [Rotaria socialis]
MSSQFSYNTSSCNIILSFITQLAVWSNIHNNFYLWHFINLLLKKLYTFARLHKMLNIMAAHVIKIA